MSKNTTIEIFRAGRHTAMNGQTIDFSAADLAGMAKSYDRNLFDAPCVVGHPQHDNPAYAWAEGLSVDGDKLVATVTDVDPAFAEMVNAKRFKKISPAFYPPDDASNPKPGSYYLRHIGFLGAAAPAVKGLKDAAFADDASTVLEFADMGDLSWPLRSIASMFRGFRDYLIADKGLDTANQVLPDWSITDLENTAASLQAPPQPVYAEHTPKEKPLNAKTPEQVQADLDAREASLKARELAFAETEKQNRAAADKALLDKLEADGKITPVAGRELLRFMGQLDTGTTLAFAEGADAPKVTAHAYFTGLLKTGLGKVITFGEVSKPGEGSETLSSDPEQRGQEIARLGLAFMEEQKGKGVTITIAQAVDHIRKQEAK